VRYYPFAVFAEQHHPEQARPSVQVYPAVGVEDAACDRLQAKLIATRTQTQPRYAVSASDDFFMDFVRFLLDCPSPDIFCGFGPLLDLSNEVRYLLYPLLAQGSQAGLEGCITHRIKFKSSISRHRSILPQNRVCGLPASGQILTAAVCVCHYACHNDFRNN